VSVCLFLFVSLSLSFGGAMAEEEDVQEAYAVVRARRPASRVALTCEHASNRIPRAWPLGWPADDARVVDTHWAIDLGAEALTRELAGKQRGARCMVSPL
jgi:predicted N-formylglutamate amidohydrolase